MTVAHFFSFALVCLLGCPLRVLGQANEATVEGTVVDQAGEPLPGISVRLDDTRGVATKTDGRFIITDVPSGEHTLSVSGVGYTTQSIPLSLTAGQTRQLAIRLEEGTTEMEEVTVVGKSEATEVREQAYAVEAIDTRALAQRNVDMNQLITRTAGVRVRESGGLGSNFDYSINGMSGRAIRFFVDGVPLDRYGSGYSINNFPVNLIERVEIYKGVVPPSLGSDVLGGAVNIIPKTGYGNYLDASYSYGSFNTHRTALSTHWTHAPSGLFVNLQGFYNYSDNNYAVWGAGVQVANPETGRAEEIRTERFHDAYRSASAKLEVGLENQAWADLLKLSFLYADNHNELQHGATMASVIGEATRAETSYTPSLQYQKDDFLLPGLHLNGYASLSFLTSVTIDTSSRTYDWRGEVVDRQPTGSELGAGRNGKSRLTLSSRNGFYQAQLSYALAPYQTLGFNYTLDDTERDGTDPFISDRTASFREPQRVTKQIASLSYELETFGQQLVHTAWAKHYSFAASTVDERYITDSLGRRPVAFPLDNDSQHLGYGYAAKYTLNPRHLLKASVERAYRLPDADEILGDGLFVRSNPELRPEQSLNVNLGWMASQLSLGREAKLSWEPTLFYRDTRDLILYLVQQSRNTGAFFNIGQVRGVGGSLDLTYAYGDFLQVKANATYQDLRDWQEFSGPNRNQTYRDRLRNTPYLMANGSVNLRRADLWQDDDELSFFWDVQYVHEFFLNWPSLGARSSKAIIPTQFINSLGVNYARQSGTYSLSLECQNAFNEQVYDNYLLQRPGRAYSVKIRAFFNQLI